MLNFTIGTNTNPNSTQVAALILIYYKSVYQRIYGNEKYSADESTDTYGVIDSEEFRAALNPLLSEKVSKWSEAFSMEDKQMPTFNLYYSSNSAEIRTQFTDALDEMVQTDEDVEFMDNCRIMGSDAGDREGVF